MLTGWRTMPDDMTIRIDGSLEGMASIPAATPSREAILEAAQALEDEHPRERTRSALQAPNEVLAVHRTLERVYAAKSDDDFFTP
jgi:hypothetical protein